MPPHVKNTQAFEQILRVTWLGIAINVILVAVKLTTGMLVSSMALVADGFHSVGDLITDFAVILGVKISKKEPDEKHQYGHGWAENFITFLTAVPLAAVGSFMVIKALNSIAKQELTKIGVPVLGVAVIAIILKEFSFRITKKVAMQLSSSMLYANAWDHRSDALSSLAVAVGAIASMFNIRFADQIATIVVGIMVVYVGIKILLDSISQFTAKSVNEETTEQIKKILGSQKQIQGWHKLRTRIVGRELFMDLHIVVDPALNITDAHNISEMLENELHKQISQPVNIVIHIEPNEDFKPL